MKTISILLLLVLAGCTSVATQPAIHIKDFAYGESIVHIQAGQMLQWVNDDEMPHSVTGSGFSSDLLQKGKSWSHVFAAKGQYDYKCTAHPWMRGKIIVE